MKNNKKILLLLFPLLISGCFHISKDNIHKYGIFLGEDDSHINELIKYQSIAIDLDEFDESNIKRIKDNKTEIYAYLSVGSLETYRPYYEEYKDYTFKDYDNWEDERWIDVSNLSWQEHITSEANRLKVLGADGLFLDNFDVYYIVKEEYECSEQFKEDIYFGCHQILDNLSKLDIKLMINSGTDFLERLYEEEDGLLNKIDVYAQECVFSSIVDYKEDIFSKQDEEAKEYYLDIISFMKNSSEILLIEYTKDDSLIKSINEFCKDNNYYCYISNNVDLTL